MGSNFATDLASGEFVQDLHTQISIHLSSNHFPVVPQVLVDPCIKAIESCNDGSWDAHVELPEGITYRGETSAPASAIVDGYHLHFWLEEEDWD